jgi:hypothetical protein
MGLALSQQLCSSSSRRMPELALQPPCYQAARVAGSSRPRCAGAATLGCGEPVHRGSRQQVQQDATQPLPPGAVQPQQQQQHQRQQQGLRCALPGRTCDVTCVLAPAAGTCWLAALTGAGCESGLNQVPLQLHSTWLVLVPALCALAPAICSCLWHAVVWSSASSGTLWGFADHEELVCWR